MKENRVALFSQNLAGGGAERVLVNLASGFIASGMEVDLVLVCPEGPLLSVVPPQVRIVGLEKRRTMLSILALARYLRRERPAVLLSALAHVNIAAILASRLSREATRVAITEHIVGSIELKNTNRYMSKFLNILAKFIYQFADLIIAVSHGTAEDLSRTSGIPLPRIRTIYNPVVTPDLLAKSVEPLAHSWLTPRHAPVILGVGRLEPQKDFPTLIRAFADVRKNREAKLVILGEGTERPKLESLIHDLGLTDDVALPGFTINPYAWMSRSSLLALSSRWEGLPTVLIEAMACGTPVVSTDCPSGPSEILEGGKYGRLVGVGDVQALAGAILETLDRPPDPELIRNRAQDFTVERIVDKYLAVLLRSEGT